MSAEDVLAILPLVVLAATVVLGLLLAAARPPHGVLAAFSALGLLATLAVLPVALAHAPRGVTPLLAADPFALFFVGLDAGAALCVIALGYGYLRGREEHPEAFYLLVLLAVFGAGVLAASRHFASLFLGLETLVVSLYGLVAYRRRAPRAVEAGLKYLVLAGASSAFLLFGMALVFAGTGALDLAGVAAAVRAGTGPVILTAGTVLVLVGLGFELALVPFHFWTPDVYEGASPPVGAFVATVSKGTVLAVLLRWLLGSGLLAVPSFSDVVVILAVASMLAGNLLALLQTNVKRILAYSSIAHVGYMLVGLLALGTQAVEAVSFYLVTYFVTTLVAFGVLTVLSTKEADLEDLGAFRGLFWRRPYLATALSATLFSLAGIPLTAGFFGKYLVVLAGVGARIWLPVSILVLGSIVGLFVYLRIVITMAAREEGDVEARPEGPAPSLSIAGGLTLAALVLLLFWIGVYPTPFVRWVLPAVGSLL